MKNIVLICILVFNVFNNLYSQVFQDWVARYNGPGNSMDGAQSIVVDGSGNVYVTGGSTGNGTNIDYTTIKYNSLGVQQWVSRYNGPGNLDDIATTLFVDGTGNVYVTGESYGGSGTDIDYATIKYNSSGMQQWATRYNGPGNGSDYAYSLAVDGTGNVYVSGESMGSGTDFDYATLKYNSAGVQQWVQRYNGPGNIDDGAYSLMVDGTGNVYVTGESMGSGSDYDYATIKYNSSGVQQWVQRYDGPGNGSDFASRIVLDAYGNAYVAGSSTGIGSNHDYAILKYNSSGVQQWVQRYNGPGNSEDYVSSLALDVSGNLYLTGQSMGSVLDFDYATIKYNSTGVQQWVARYNGPGNLDDIATSLAVDGSSNVYVTGQSMGNGTDRDYTTIKYTSSGIEQWTQRYNGLGNSYDDPFSLVVDGSGNVYVTGQSGGNGTGDDYATIKYSQQQLIVNQPTGYVKWIAGEIDTIRWSGTIWTLVNIKCSLNVGTSQQSEITIAQNVSNANQSFVWDIPVDMLSFRSKIFIENSALPNEKIESGIFRIKPYLLTRFTINGIDTTYYEFRKDRDQWGFWNDSAQMWPQQWYQQFNYQGIDPFTNSPYSQWQGFGTFFSAQSKDFPDWISWVNTFTINACYLSTSLHIYSPLALLLWEIHKRSWNGSCFGLAVSDGIVFRNKSEFYSKYPGFPQFTDPHIVQSTNPVKKVINELFTHQFGKPHSNYRRDQRNNKTPVQTLREIRSMLFSENESVKTLDLFPNGSLSGGHSVLPYKITRDNNLYKVDIYDNANPNSPNPIVIDTLANFGNGSWLYANRPNWGGNANLFLMDASVDYLTNPTFSRENNHLSPFVFSDSILKVYNSDRTDIIIKDVNGNITGFSHDSIYLNIPRSYPELVSNSNETPPLGFELPAQNYNIQFNQFHNDTISSCFLIGKSLFYYKRAPATQGQTDKFYFNGGLTISNSDIQVKTISLVNITNENTQEKLLAVNTLNLMQNDSIRIENIDSNQTKLISTGSPKSYNLELNFVTQSDLGRFGAFTINLPANSSHTFVPQWQNLQNSQLIILVDLGNNGTIDDTLRLSNQIIGVSIEGNSLPTKYKLAQNYPNPFNPLTTISYDIIKKVKTILTVFNVLGQEVVKLIDEIKEPGSYKVYWDASNYPSGVYFYKLEAGDFVDSKKMILLK